MMFPPAVIPGRAAGASPESMSTGRAKFARSVFMDSGLPRGARGPARRRPTGCDPTPPPEKK
jgi:hypothetical protein